MSDIYARQRTVHAGSFPSDQAAMSLAGSLLALGIVQNAQFGFAQQVSRVYDVSNGGFGGASGGLVPVYYVGGRTQGQGTIGRVLGPQSNALSEFYSLLGNICTPQDLSFTFRAGCGSEGTSRVANAAGRSGLLQMVYTVESAVMVNHALSVDSNSMMVSDNLSMIFANARSEETTIG